MIGLHVARAMLQRALLARWVDPIPSSYRLDYRSAGRFYSRFDIRSSSISLRPKAVSISALGLGACRAILCALSNFINIYARLVSALDRAFVLKQSAWLPYIIVKCVIEYRNNESVPLLGIQEIRHALR